MRAITAYRAEDGSLHERPEDAQMADKGAAYRGRVDAFIARSPLFYEAARDMEEWLKTDEGLACAKTLVGVVW